MQCKGVAYTRKEPQNYSIKFYFVQYNSLVKIPKVGKDINTRIYSYIYVFGFQSKFTSMYIIIGILYKGKISKIEPTVSIITLSSPWQHGAGTARV